MNELKNSGYTHIIEDFAAVKQNQSSAEWKLGYWPTFLLLNPKGGLTILDLGCGPARFSRELSSAGAKVIGIDANEDMIQAASDFDPSGSYYHCPDGNIKQFCEGVEIDQVVSTFALCEMKDETLKSLLAQVSDLLGGDGKRFVILLPNLEESLNIAYPAIWSEGEKVTGSPVNVRLKQVDNWLDLGPVDVYRTEADYRSILIEAGFKSVESYRPKPTSGWGSEWDLERTHPPLLILVSTK